MSLMTLDKFTDSNDDFLDTEIDLNETDLFTRPQTGQYIDYTSKTP